jgi:hypothetical protein
MSPAPQSPIASHAYGSQEPASHAQSDPPHGQHPGLSDTGHAGFNSFDTSAWFAAGVDARPPSSTKMTPASWRSG